MRTTTSVATVAGLAALASAQQPSQSASQMPPIAPSTGAGDNSTFNPISPKEIGQYVLELLSDQCQDTVKGLLNDSAIYECMQIDSLLPAILVNTSIVPEVDYYLSAVCYNAPCSTATLNQTADAIIGGCASDLKEVGVDNQTVHDVFGLYPLAREVACLKTSNPTNVTNAPIPIDSPEYNNTGGVFCVTDLMTELSGVVGANLTNNYVDTLALGGNSTALQLLQNLTVSDLCNECIFAAVDIVESEYPQLGNVSVGANITVNDFLDKSCPGYNVSTNGTLPTNITVAIENSTFPETIVADTTTYTPGSDAVAAPTLDSPFEKSLGIDSVLYPSGTAAPTVTALTSMLAGSGAAGTPSVSAAMTSAAAATSA